MCKVDLYRKKRLHINSIDHGRSLPSTFCFETLTKIIKPQLIAGALTQAGRHEKRVRRLPAAAVVWLVIAIGLFSDQDQTSIWRQVVGTLTALFQAMGNIKLVTRGAISRARKRLGARAMYLLFQAVSNPVGTNKTIGAFYREHRLMAIDGDTYHLPDTPANAKAFGRTAGQRFGQIARSAYPQAKIIRLIETGTHVTTAAFIKPANASEHPSAMALLRRVPENSIVMEDRGIYSFALVKQASKHNIYLLNRISTRLILEPIRMLSDDSTLVTIYATTHDREQKRNGIIVRIIRYTIEDPDRPGHRIEHKLMTTLLDEKKYPAMELIVLYHQRWEIEIANDEITTHQLNRKVELRSLTPAGVVQELYGILLAHNAIRMLMHEAAQRVEIDPRRLSFIGSVRVIRDSIKIMRNATVEQLPILYRALVMQISDCRLPKRENRINPRVVKVKMSPYLKKRPHDIGVKVKTFSEVVRMLNTTTNLH